MMARRRPDPVHWRLNAWHWAGVAIGAAIWVVPALIILAAFGVGPLA